jgi:hypothetical protein
MRDLCLNQLKHGFRNSGVNSFIYGIAVSLKEPRSSRQLQFYTAYEKEVDQFELVTS